MPRRVLQGRVVSNANDKTVIVSVERRFKHPVYKKFVKRTKRYAAHDPENRFRVGEFVRLEECRPISRRKHWWAYPAGTQGEALSADAGSES